MERSTCGYGKAVGCVLTVGCQCAALAGLLTFAYPTSAALLGGPKTGQPLVEAVSAGFTVNDLSISFEGRLLGQQLVLELTEGSLFNSEFGSDTPPNPLLATIADDVLADSFIGLGGADSTLTAPILVIGGSADIPGKNGLRRFDDTGINLTWAPTPGTVITDQTDYFIARLTLSDDARGRVLYFASIDGDTGLFEGVIFDGMVSAVFAPPLNPQVRPDPEPATAAMAVLCCLGVGVSRCRVRSAIDPAG